MNGGAVRRVTFGRVASEYDPGTLKVSNIIKEIFILRDDEKASLDPRYKSMRKEERLNRIIALKGVLSTHKEHLMALWNAYFFAILCSPTFNIDKYLTNSIFMRVLTTSKNVHGENLFLQAVIDENITAMKRIAELLKCFWSEKSIETLLTDTDNELGKSACEVALEKKNTDVLKTMVEIANSLPEKSPILKFFVDDVKDLFILLDRKILSYDPVIDSKKTAYNLINNLFILLDNEKASLDPRYQSISKEERHLRAEIIIMCLAANKEYWVTLLNAHNERNQDFFRLRRQFMQDCVRAGIVSTAGEVATASSAASGAAAATGGAGAASAAATLPVGAAGAASGGAAAPTAIVGSFAGAVGLGSTTSSQAPSAATTAATGRATTAASSTGTAPEEDVSMGVKL